MPSTARQTARDGGVVATQPDLPGSEATAVLEPADPPDLEPLVVRARDGDAEAFGALYDALAPAALRLLRGLRLLDPAGVEDALQESFLRLLERLPRLDRPARVRGYLLGIAHHVAVDLARAATTPSVRRPSR